MPIRRPNSEIRPREHLTEREVEKLIDAAKGNRYGVRDATMILMAFRHGLRASELCGLEWSDVEFESSRPLHVRRAKGGTTTTHPLLGDELRALRVLKRDAKSPFVLFDRAWCAVLHFRLGQAHRARRCRGQDAIPGSPAHAAPRLLIRAGQQGHRYPDPAGLPRPSVDPEHRALPELAPGRFKNLWR